MRVRPARQRLSAPQRRQLILDAAREVFVEEGFAGARTRVIAERAGITEAILYQHFASKDELFELVVLNPVREQAVAMAHKIGTWVRTADDAGAQNMEVVLREAHRMVLTGLGYMLPLMGVAILADRRSSTADYRNELYTAMAEVLEEVGKTLGTKRAVVDDPILLTLLAMSLGPTLDAHFRGVPLDVEAISSQTAALLVQGLSRPPPGAKSVTTKPKAAKAPARSRASS